MKGCEKIKKKEVNIINWHYEDEDYKKFVIYGFGKTEKGKEVSIKIKNYHPEMYIRIVDRNEKEDNNKFMKKLEKDDEFLNKLLNSLNFICSKKLCCKKEESESKNSEEDSESDKNINEYCCLEHNPHDIFGNAEDVKKQHIIKRYCKIEHKKDLYEKFGYNDIIVLKLVFSTLTAFNKIKKLLKHKIIDFNGFVKKNKYVKMENILLHKQKNYKVLLYKSDLPPLLDFFHKKDIEPCGWCLIKDYKELENNNVCDKLKYEVEFKNIERVEKLDFAPFKIMSWDIEADSSHGDFPLAKKNYKKLSMEIGDYYLNFIKYNKDIKDENIFNNIIRYCLIIAFRLENIVDVKLEDKIKRDIKNNINVVYLKSNLLPHHIDKIEESRLINKIYVILKKNKINKLLDVGDSNISLYFNKNDNMEEILSDDENENKIINNKKLSNRDIIINKLNNIFEDEFREVQGDRIIQIGCVFHLFGKKEKNKKYILTLGSCDKFDEDTKIYSFAKEKEYIEYRTDELDTEETKLILKFQEIINKEQPNIILGYNTFGFDNKFLYERCEELYIDDTFGYIGKLKNKKSKLIKKELSSSALGDNILFTLPSIGRTEIDLLKLVQRDHNLDSYSLNNVSSVFIGDKKDDVSPKQIFEYQRQTSEKRGIIAKYCIKDCVLLIDLMNKLDKLSANIGMANVCSVPLEFIILRGQGIKVQSLVSKECNIENYILRELEKEKSNSSYEGAIVLPPKKGMYLEDPVAVLDYASLYPSSMIASNISHEVIVKTEFYKNGNLEEIEDINLQNMKDGIHFKFTDKYKQYEGFNVKEYEEEIKSYNRYPLLDSIYIQSLKYRFIKKCKSKLYIAEKFYENIENKDFDIDKYKLEYDKLSKEDKTKYNRNVYYPYNAKIDNLVENENMDYVNYISICFDTYTGKGDKKEKDGVKKITLAHPCNIEKYDNTDEYPDQTISKRGIMPKILRKLLKARKDTRKKIPLEKDEFKKGVLEGLQLGYKLSANSLYGQTGASTSAIFKQDVAAATTSTGRQMLNLCSSFAVQYYDCDIVYGDSITSDEPLILRNRQGLIEIKTIETLSEEWEIYENFKPFDTIQSNRRDKQKAFVNYEVFANNKWNPIKKVIRHKTNKKIYRVNTHCGVVDVTEDHSLLSDKREKIKPGECVVGETKLFHCFPNEFNEVDAYVPQQNEPKEEINREELIECSTCKNSYLADNYYFIDKSKTKRSKQCKICVKRKQCERQGRVFKEEIQSKEDIYRESYLLTEEEAKIWGMFMGDGSCGCYDSKWGLKYSWALNNNNLERLNVYKDLLEKIEPLKFKILDTLKSSGVYKLVPVGSLKYMVEKYRPLLYYEKAKIVPNIVLNGKLEIKKAFFEGYYDADGCKTGNYGLDKRMHFVTKNKISAQSLYYLAKSIGYNKLYINIQEKRIEKNKNYYWVSSCKKYGKNPNILKKMIYLRDSEDEYVYDLETEFGTFCAGVGELEISNTDSVFIKYKSYSEDGVELKGKDRIRFGIQTSLKLEHSIATFLRKPHYLEFEKEFHPFILFSKKRYIGYLYEDDWTVVPKLKYMGIVLKRRDNANIVKIIYSGIITRLLEDKTIDSAIVFLKEKLQELIDGKFAMEDLTVTKTLRGYYKNPEGIAHKVLADRMKERDPGSAPASNDRVPYVYINVKEKKGVKLLQGDRVEHPDFIRENNLQIDYSVYIENQLKKPIIQILELCLKKPELPFQDVLNKLKRVKIGVKDISSYFK